MARGTSWSGGEGEEARRRGGCGRQGMHWCVCVCVRVGEWVRKRVRPWQLGETRDLQ